MKCVFCNVREADSAEHIVLDSLGGKKTVYDLTCGRCNSRFGNGVDGEFELACRMTNILLGNRSGRRGELPAPLGGLRTTTGLRVTLGSDGVLSVEPQTPMSLDNRVDGSVSANVEATTPAKLAVLLVNAVAAAEVAHRPLMHAQTRLTDHAIGGVPLEFRFGAADQARCVMKMALAAIVKEVAREQLPSGLVSSAVAFIDGGTEGPRRLYFLDGSIRQRVRDHTGIAVGDHGLLLFNSPRTLEAIFFLFGTFPFRVRLWDEPVAALSRAVLHRVSPRTREHNVEPVSVPSYWDSFAWENRLSRANKAAARDAFDALAAVVEARPLPSATVVWDDVVRADVLAHVAEELGRDKHKGKDLDAVREGVELILARASGAAEQATPK